MHPVVAFLLGAATIGLGAVAVVTLRPAQAQPVPGLDRRVERLEYQQDRREQEELSERFLGPR